MPSVQELICSVGEQCSVLYYLVVVGRHLNKCHTIFIYIPCNVTQRVSHFNQHGKQIWKQDISYILMYVINKWAPATK